MNKDRARQFPNRRASFWCFCIALCLLSAVQAASFAAKVEEVVEEGCAPVHENLGLSRDEAKRAALRAAVEKVVGVQIYSDTKVVDFVVAYNKVLMNSAGYVRSSEIIPGSERGDDELYCLKVRVEVVVDAALADIIKDVKTLCFIQEHYHKPRVMVAITEEFFGSESRMPISETEATRYLEDICMNTVDREQAGEISDNDLMKTLLHGDEDLKSVEDIDDIDLKSALKVLLSAGAEWLLKGYAVVDDDSCSEEEAYGVDITTCQASVRIKMINTKSGQVIAPFVVNQNAGSRVGSRKTVARDALLKATGAAMENSVIKIVDTWKVGTAGEGTCTETVVTVAGASAKQFNKIKGHIGGEREICSIDTLNFSSGGISKLSVNAKFTGQELFDYLMESEIPGLDYEIVSYSQNSLDIKVNE